MFPADLPLTGERTVPGIPHENYWFRRHQAAYEFVAPLVRDLTVLEVGSGEGYGIARLAADARAVVGVDYDSSAIEHAARRYPQAGFVRGNLAALPVATRTVDALVALQVIEHVWDHGQFLRECHRVLRPGGRLFVSTPNRLTFSPGRDTPVNPFHTHEFTVEELTGLIESTGFRIERRLGLQAGPRLRQWDETWGGSFVDAQLAAPPEQWPSGLLTDVSAVTVNDFAVTDAQLDRCLDVVVVATPAG